MIGVFLIRHGESESNAGLSTSDPALVPLTPAGHRQADQIARAFAEAPALVVTSPYLRARQTAQPTISRFPAAECQEWPVHEFTYLGYLHGRPTTAQERKPHARAYWDQADPHHASDGAESFTGLLNRTTDCLNRLRAQRSGPVAVFTHGLFMRAVAWALLTGVTTPGADEMRSFRSFASRYLIPNAGVVELRCTGHDDPALLGGSTIHLPAALAQRPRRGPVLLLTRGKTAAGVARTRSGYLSACVRPLVPGLGGRLDCPFELRPKQPDRIIRWLVARRARRSAWTRSW